MSFLKFYIVISYGVFLQGSVDKKSSPRKPILNSCWLFVCFPGVTTLWLYEGWNFNSGNYLFTTDTK